MSFHFINIFWYLILFSGMGIYVDLNENGSK